MSILQQLYKYSPMNFYTVKDGKTILKSIDVAPHGYEFDREFTSEELSDVWNCVKLHKRVSTILIFLFFLLLLYLIIFPKFVFLVNNRWYINAVIIIFAASLVCKCVASVFTIFFEQNLRKKFGNFNKVKFERLSVIDPKYYCIYKFELLKVFIVLTGIILMFVFINPFDITKNLLSKGRYNDVIKITTAGSNIFPIAQEWYSMRGWANYRLGNYTEAINDFDTAYYLGADGFNIMNFDNKIFVKYQLKEYDSAINDFDRAIRIANNDDERDEFLWDKAQFLYNIGQYEKALDVYDELIIKAEDDRVFLLKDRLYAERAMVYKALGNEEAAAQDIEKSAIQDLDDVNIPKPVLMLDEETFSEE